MELVADTIQRFQKLYGNDPEVVVTAPGRVNLIGEHTDYNNGYVLPVAINRKIIIAAGNRSDSSLHLHTADLQSSVEVKLSHLLYNSYENWSNYPIGVASVLQGRGYRVRGANLCVRGDIPIAAGLSSSAAFEIASAIVYSYLNNISLTPLEIIQFACQAENGFVGVQCGIMDQYVSVMGKKNHAMFLDCATLQHRHIKIPEGVQIVVCDTGIKRELTRSAYNRREAECDDAVHQISKYYSSISSLRAVSPEMFEELQQKLTPIAQKRARHVVYENDRVLQCIHAMESSDLLSVGKLMYESHRSLRDDFEVSCRELDVFVEIAAESNGVYGARMTGAGFGGSAICLVDRKNIDSLVDQLRAEYPKRANHSLTIHLVDTDNGAAIIQPTAASTPYCYADSAS